MSTEPTAAMAMVDLHELQREGFLQEANRQFFHPLGLALTLVVEDDGRTHLQAQRTDDREGWEFTWEDPHGALEKAARVVEERILRETARKHHLGGHLIQPLPDARIGPRSGFEPEAVYSHPDCTFNYCPHPGDCRPGGRCALSMNTQEGEPK